MTTKEVMLGLVIAIIVGSISITLTLYSVNKVLSTEDPPTPQEQPEVDLCDYNSNLWAKINCIEGRITELEKRLVILENRTGDFVE
jgi:hypothetical protein